MSNQPSHRRSSVLKCAVVVGILMVGDTGRDPVSAEDLLVPENYPTIQAALDAAGVGDTVSVAPGTYGENVVFISDDVVLRSRTLHAATIDGGGRGHVVSINNRTGTVEGFVITGGGTGYYSGVFTSQKNQLIRNNIITNNAARGIAVSSGSYAQIDANQILNNGDFKAGVLVSASSAVITNSLIANNSHGIEAYAGAGSLIVVNNTFSGNRYAGIWVTAYFPGRIQNNIIAGGDLAVYIQGPCAQYPDSFLAGLYTISHNDVFSNLGYYTELYGPLCGPWEYGGSFLPSPGTGEMWQDPQFSSSGDRSLSAHSPCIDSGNTEALPEGLLWDLSGRPRVQGARIDIGANEFGESTPLMIQDFRVSTSDTRVSLAWRLSESELEWIRSVSLERAEDVPGQYRTVIDGLKPRALMQAPDDDVQGGSVYWYRVVLYPFEGSKTESFAMRTVIPHAETTLRSVRRQGGVVRVEFTLGQCERVSLQVYDARGRRVATLEEGRVEAGDHSVTWDVHDTVAPGVYLVAFRTPRAHESRKIVLRTE